MGSVSYSAHISNGKSAITSKSKLKGVAKHDLRKYKSDGYSSENIILIEGTENLYQDVRNFTSKNLTKSSENTMKSKNYQKKELMIILNMLQNWIRIWRWKLSSNVGIKNFGKRMKKVKKECIMFTDIFFLIAIICARF